MITTVTETLKPYAPYAIPHPAGAWQRFLEAWRDPDPAYSCLKCGGGMKRRKGKRGAFLGCTSYPDCKGTRPAPPIALRSTVCPLCDVGRVITKTSGRGNEYKQCDGCDAFIGSRFTTKAEKVFAKAAKAEEKAKKHLAKERKAAKARGLQPEMIIQLPVEGFDYKEWFGEGWGE